jgi:hypothetical protein
VGLPLTSSLNSGAVDGRRARRRVVFASAAWGHVQGDVEALGEEGRDAVVVPADSLRGAAAALGVAAGAW